jgi:hypothetical protein
MARWWVPFLWLAALTLAVACGGGGAKAPATATAPPAETGGSTPAVTMTPEITPIVSDGQFKAPAKGYGVQIPEGWIARPNFMPTTTSSTDVFFAPVDESPVRPNIAVTCEQVEQGTSLEQYIGQKREIATVTTGHTPEAEKREVSGGEATLLTYSLTKEPVVDKVEAYFQGKDCIWTVALAVPGGQRETYRPTFQAFLSSFQLLQ